MYIYPPASQGPATPAPSSLPDIAQTLEARQLAGASPYNMAAGSRDVAWKPKWDQKYRPEMVERTKDFYKGENHTTWAVIRFCIMSGLVSLIAFAIFQFTLENDIVEQY